MLRAYTGEEAIQIATSTTPAGASCTVQQNQLVLVSGGCNPSVSAPAGLADGSYPVLITISANNKTASLTVNVEVLRRRRPAGKVNNTSVQLYGQVEATVLERVDVETCGVKLIGDAVTATPSIVPDKVTMTSDCSKVVYEPGNSREPLVRTLETCFYSTSPGSISSCVRFDVARQMPRLTQIVAKGYVCYSGVNTIEWHSPEGLIVPRVTTVLLHDPNLEWGAPPGIVPTFYSRYLAKSVIGGSFPVGREPPNMVPTATNDSTVWEVTGSPIPTQPCPSASIQALPGIAPDVEVQMVETTPGVFQGPLLPPQIN
jgi:hypothetical protein